MSVDRKKFRREVFDAALQHRNTGKVPVDFGATAVTGLHVSCVDGLRRHYGLEKRPVKVHEPYQMLGFVEDDLADALDLGVTGVPGRMTMFGFEASGWKEFTLESGLEVLVPGGFQVTRDAAGNTFLYPEGDRGAPPSGKMPKGGYYFDAIVRQPPVDEDNLRVEDNLEEFGPPSETDIEYQKRMLRQAHLTGRGVITGFGGTALGDIALVPAVQLKHPRGIRDIEEWYVTVASRQNFVHELFERQTDIALKNLQIYHDAVGNTPDVAFICGTDFGTQNGTFCSETTFRELYMPYYRKINDWIHSHTGWKTLKHSCGAIAGFIPLFIEAGFDVLNPVQCSCPGMEPEKIKRDFGRDIVFWGGGVDTQHLLPFGKPEEVREQVLRRLEIFGRDGGFIFNAIHNVQSGTPVENIVAMIEAAREFNA